MPRQLPFTLSRECRALDILGAAHRRRLRCVAAEKNGAVAVTFALLFVPLLGAVALGAEMGLWYVTQRTMQSAADSAAFSASVARMSGADSTVFTEEATAVAAKNGYTKGAGGVTVAVNSPPTTGSYTNRSDAIEVIVRRPQIALFTRLFQPTGPTIAARGVALMGESGKVCVLALDTGDVTDVTDTGNTAVNLNHCSLYVDSPNVKALTINGTAKINAESAFISGNYSLIGGGQLNTIDGTFTHMSPLNDPYADVTMPQPSGCGGGINTRISGHKTVNLSPGTYCSGIQLTGNSTINLSPGVYVIDQGALSVAGGSTVNATGGVTIVLTSSTGSNYATVDFAGGANINITAPSSGPLSGLAFFQDRHAPSSGSDNFTGGATQKIIGAIYLPNQNVKYAGGTATGGQKCTQLVAYTITFNGNATFNTDCTGVGTKNIGSAPTKLVE